MKKTPLQIFALAVVLSFVGAVAAAAHKSSDKPSEKKVLEDIAGYKSWKRVTVEPVRVPSDSASPGGG
jgi:hypothetical protein